MTEQERFDLVFEQHFPSAYIHKQWEVHAQHFYKGCFTMWQAAQQKEGFVVVKPALDSAAKCKMIGEYTFRVNDTDTLITVPWSMIKQIYKDGIECMIQAAQENNHDC